jgi:hypothetical protein
MTLWGRSPTCGRCLTGLVGNYGQGGLAIRRRLAACPTWLRSNS